MRIRGWGRFRGYNIKALQKDLVSGVIVGIVAIPLAMGFAIASGVKPEYGIYTTIIAGVCISLFGGSRFQIGGPTGAFVPILLSIVLTHGYQNLLVAGFLAGVILVLMGVFKLGALISYIPRSVTIGFTSGIAVTIFTGQIPNFLGLQHLHPHDSFLASMVEIVKHLHTINFPNLVVGIISLIIIVWLQKISKRIPVALVGLIVSTVAACVFFPHQVPTIGTKYGGLPSQLPSVHWMHFSVHTIQQLLGPALVIAMLGGIESLLSAVVADGMTNTKHHSNRELIGQGIANMVAPLFGGIPATGAIARTATNIKNGAVSPVSGIVHGVLVALILLLVAPFASHIPLAGMAPILMMVAWNMSERQEFKHILSMRTGDSSVLLVTFVCTVFFTLTIAIGVGLCLSVLLFTRRMGNVFRLQKVLPDQSHPSARVKPSVVTDTHDCPQISMFTIEGPIFFAAAQAFEEAIKRAIHTQTKVLILRMSQVPFLDTTGQSYLLKVVTDVQNHGGTVILSGVTPGCRKELMDTGLWDIIGTRNCFEHTGEAIHHALSKIEHPLCIGCTHFAFKECTRFSDSNPVTHTNVM